MSVWESRRTPTSHSWECEFHPQSGVATASQPKGDFGAKPKGACFNYNEVGHYSKDCPKSKAGSGSAKVFALNANLTQPE